MILADMSNGNEANRKRTADGLYNDDHSPAVGGAESALASDGNKKLKTEHSGNGLPSVQTTEKQAENVEPIHADQSSSVTPPKSPAKLARSPSPVKPARHASPMHVQSPGKMDTERRQPSPVRMEVTLDTPEITPMHRLVSPARQPAQQEPSVSSQKAGSSRSPLHSAAEPQPKPKVEATPSSPAAMEGVVQQQIAEQDQQLEQIPEQPDNSLDSEPATPSISGSAARNDGAGSDELLKAQMKWAANSLRSLKRCNDIPPFLQPVDPVALGIPHYFDVIKNPMDLSTIDKKLQSQSYATAQEYIEDVRLMLNNCFTFNPVGHLVYDMGKRVEKVFEAAVKRMPLKLSDLKHEQPKPSSSSNRLSISGSPNSSRPKREVLSTAAVYPIDDGPKRKKGKAKPDDIKWCFNVYNELLKKKYEMFMFVFYKPVDPVALNIPQYFDVIKEPMDLSTMKKKLDMGEYETAEEFEADFRLMIRNCYTFNRPGDDVYLMGQRAEEVFNLKWAEKMVFLAKAAAAHQSSAANKPGKKRKSISGTKAAIGGRPSFGSMPNESSSDEEDDLTKSSQLQQMIQQQLLLLQELSKQKKSKKSSGGGKKSGDSRRASKMSMGGDSSIGGSVESLSGGGGGVGGESQAAGGAAAPSVPAQPKPAAPRPKAPSQPKKKKKDEIREITFEEKKELSEAINTLAGDKLGRVVQIIHESMPQLQGESGQEEIELDIDSLDLVTLNKLWNFVKGSANRRKPKGPLEANQAAAAARIHELEMELARLEGRSDKTKLLQDNAEIINGGSGQQSVNESESSDSEEEEEEEEAEGAEEAGAAAGETVDI